MRRALIDRSLCRRYCLLTLLMVQARSTLSGDNMRGDRLAEKFETIKQVNSQVRDFYVTVLEGLAITRTTKCAPVASSDIHIDAHSCKREKEKNIVRLLEPYDNSMICISLANCVSNREVLESDTAGWTVRISQTSPAPRVRRGDGVLLSEPAAVVSSRPLQRRSRHIVVVVVGVAGIYGCAEIRVAAAAMRFLLLVALSTDSRRDGPHL